MEEDQKMEELAEPVSAPIIHKKKFRLNKKTFWGIIAGIVVVATLGVIFGLNPEIFKGSRNDDNAQKPAFAEVMNKYHASASKSGNLSFKVRLSLYDSDGVPMSTTQQITATRTQKDGYYYLGGEAKTDKVTLEFKNLVNYAAGMMESTTPSDYIDGKTRIVFEGGIYNGFYNGRMDVAAVGEDPDYKIEDQHGDLENQFYGVSENDIQAFAEDLGYQAATPFTPIDYMMKISLDSFDWSQYADSASVEFSDTTQSYNYRLTIPGDALKAAVIAQIDLFTAFFAATQDEDIAEFLTMYADNKAFLASLFTVSDCVVTAKADWDGTLLSLGYAFNYNMRITDQQIIDKASQYGETDKLPLMLAAAHIFVGSKNNASAFDFDFAVELTEAYTYGSAVTVDPSSVIFAGASASPEGRSVYAYVYDEEAEEYILKRTTLNH